MKPACYEPTRLPLSLTTIMAREDCLFGRCDHNVAKYSPAYREAWTREAWDNETVVHHLINR